MRPVGGWEKINYTPFASTLRKMHRWLANTGITYSAFLCEEHCYVEVGGVLVDITPLGGLATPAANRAGYGDDKYSLGKYGTPRPGPSHLSVNAHMYSMDNWGEELRVMTSPDGRYLGWKPSDPPGTLLTAIAGAPVGNRSFVITPERHAMLFGMDSAFDKFGWSDEEDDTNWAFGDVLSRARFYDVSPKSQIITTLLFASGIIMWTPAMSYIIEWVGLPYVYGYRPIGKASVPMSPASISETPNGVIWPAVDGWWIFDGSVPRLFPCPIWDFIQDHIDVPHSRYTSCCVHAASQGEVWWFYVDVDAPTFDNNRVAIYDYRSDLWSMGKLSRTCGFSYANEIYPAMSDGVSVWKHETGFSYPGTDYPWIETFNLNLTGGEQFFTLKRILPDISGDANALRFRMAKTNARAGYTADVYTPQRAKNPSGYVDIRETGRDMRLRIEMVSSSNWGTVGPILFDGVTRGKQ